MLKPMLRTIWLMESTLAVSPWGTSTRTSLGMTAKTSPTAEAEQSYCCEDGEQGAIGGGNQ